jgi:HEAT repeat protein
MGVAKAWKRLTINFASKEVLLKQVKVQLIKTNGKLSPLLQELLQRLVPQELAEAICQVGGELPPMAVYALNNFVLEEGIAEEWISLLAVVRKEAHKLVLIEALGILRLNQAAWPLVELLKSRNGAVQMAAAKALGRMSTRKLIPALIEGIKKEEFWLPARVAPVILTEPELAAPLLKQLLMEKELPEDVYLAAIELLKEMRRPDTAALLEEIFAGHTVKVQGKILEILTELDGVKIQSLATALLEHPAWQLRLQAVNTLKDLQVPGWLELVKPLAQDENQRVRQMVVWVLKSEKSEEKGGEARA